MERLCNLFRKIVMVRKGQNILDQRIHKWEWNKNIEPSDPICGAIRTVKMSWLWSRVTCEECLKLRYSDSS